MLFLSSGKQFDDQTVPKLHAALTMIYPQLSTLTGAEPVDNLLQLWVDYGDNQRLVHNAQSRFMISKKAFIKKHPKIPPRQFAGEGFLLLAIMFFNKFSL
jgi:hypothetical protein